MSNPTPTRFATEQKVVGATVLAWLVFLFDVRIGLLLGVLAYLGIVAAIIRSSLRRLHWDSICGAILGILMLTLPIWPLYAASLYEKWVRF